MVLRINNHTVETYESLSEMPMVNFHLFNKYIVLNSEIGWDLDAIRGHIEKVMRFVHQGAKDKAALELTNTLQSLTFAIENVGTDSMAFVCLCREIDGRNVILKDDESVKRWQERLSAWRFTMGVIWETVSALKKKFEAELSVYFPGVLDSAAEKEYYSRLLQKTRLQLNAVAYEQDYSKEIEEIDNYLLDMYRPKAFHGPQGVEVNFFRSFQDNCVLINQNTNLDADRLTVIEFLQTLDYLKRQFKKIKQNAH